MHLKWYIDLILMLVGFIAAAVDTIAGGGGLITVPALLLCGISPVLTLGTIKLQASVAELSATFYFLRNAKINYKVLIPLAIYTIVFVALGVVCLKFIPVHALEKIVPFLLLFILIYYIYTQRRKNIHFSDTIKPNQKKFFLLGSIIGFYNGFFGPGTGSIWAVALMKAFKLDIKKATMYAKPLNFIGNFTAIFIFLYNRDVIFSIAILMSIGSFLGARVGGKIVINKDVRVLKIIFIIVMIASVISTFVKFYF